MKGADVCVCAKMVPIQKAFALSLLRKFSKFEIMEKQIIEPDIIGGQGQLTKEEESAISKYLAAQKSKGKRKVILNPKTKKREKVI